MIRPRILSIIALAALATSFSACSGAGNNASLPNTLGDSGVTVSDTTDALVARRTGSQDARAGIAAANALGARMRQLGIVSADDAWQSLDARNASARSCHDGVELFAPDRNGTANSTEALFFYDPGCSKLAVDDVRVYAPTSATSETVSRSDAFFLPASAWVAARAITQSTISSATFGNYGIPVARNGFSLHSVTDVSLGKTTVLSTGAEFLMTPGSSTSNGFCEDSAGYDPAGIASLDETFGWQGGALSGGQRSTVGSVVNWSATPTGMLYRAPIGSLSISRNAQSTTCPIGAPAFTLNGGTAIGTYSLPFGVTFRDGILWKLTVRSAQLPSGDTLSVTTRGRRSDRTYVTGSVDNGTTPIAAFHVNAFGNGELTVISTGAQYRILDWIVLQ